MYYVYILKNNMNKLYVGQTNNLKQRLIAHERGEIRFTRSLSKFELIYFETFKNRIQSMRREKQLKGWTRAKKLALISNDMELLKKL